MRQTDNIFRDSGAPCWGVWSGGLGGVHFLDAGLCNVEEHMELGERYRQEQQLFNLGEVMIEMLSIV